MNLSTRQVVFTDSRSNETLHVNLHEELDAQYGLFLWPAAPVLAQYIFFNRNDFKNQRVLELGAGTSLPGIVAAKVGAQVVFSDAHTHVNCLQLCEKNVRLNELQEQLVSGRIKISPITWGLFTDELVSLEPVDSIIGSDCFYDEKDFEDILVTVSFIMEKSQEKQTVFYTTYQERNSDWNIECLLRKFRLRSEYISLRHFEADGQNVGESNLPGPHSILLIKITSETESRT